MKSLLRGWAPLAAALALAGCSTTGPGVGVGGGFVNFAAGSQLGLTLSRADARALADVATSALETGVSGAATRWQGPNGAQGALTPGQYFFGNLKSDPRELLPVAAAIAYATPMEIEQGDQVTTRNANVRSAPSADAPVLEKLEAGTGVDAVGKVVGQPFVLVAIKGRVRGYVHESLLTPAPGAEVALAGGPTRTPHPCRAFEQTLSLNGQSDRWSGVACNRGQGWRPEPKAGAEPGIL